MLIATVLFLNLIYATAFDALAAQPVGAQRMVGVQKLDPVTAQPVRVRTEQVQTEPAQQEAQSLTPVFQGYSNAAYVVDPYVTYTYDQMLQDAQALTAMYPGLIEMSTFGQSAEGRDLIQLRLGTGTREIILTGTIHGCEYFASGFLMYMADRYAYGYANNEIYAGYSYRELLDQVTFVIAPMLNPDGVNIAQNGLNAAADPDAVSAMDMQGATYEVWKANANGVDLNRNFPLLWSNYNGITHSCARYYAGPAAASEPETQAVIRLLDATDYWMLADFHCYGEIIYWQDNYNEITEEYRAIATRVKSETGYGDAGVEDADSFAGYLQNYARATSGRFAMTVEIGSYLLYDEADFDTAAYPLYVVGLIMADEVSRMAA